MYDINEILAQALNIYYYGSYVYGTYQSGKSDIDYIVIMPDENPYQCEQIEINNCHYNFYCKSDWQTKLNNHDVDAIEIYFLDEKFVVKEDVKFHIEINPLKIRENFSRTASNSWVKCKKKLEVEDSYNPRVAKKSLWHSLRILDFGIQILLNKKIINYGSMNHIYNQIVDCPNNDYSFYKIKYQPIYNSFKSLFRQSENIAKATWLVT